MKRVRCFFLEPTDQVEILLRRYCSEYGDPPRPPAACPLEVASILGRLEGWQGQCGPE